MGDVEVEVGRQVGDFILSEIENCRKWLEEQGYPLEFRVAQAWAKSGFHVRQSVFYDDPETNLPRELDVLAHHQRTAVSKTTAASFTTALTFLIECKSSRDAPWIVLCGVNSEKLTLPIFVQRWLVVGDKEELVRNELSRAWWSKAEIFREIDLIGHGIVRAHKKSGTDLPFHAVKQVLSATHGRAKKIAAAGEHNRCHLLFPVVVTDAHLFGAWLTPNGELELKEVPRATLFFESESGTFLSPPIIVVTIDGLEEFLLAVREMKGICELSEEIVGPWKKEA